MKKRFSGVMPAVALLAAGVVSGAARLDAAEVRADVPFSFSVKGTVLPPGTYTLSVHNGVLFVQGATAGAIVTTIALESTEQVQPCLVFHRYGDQYVLRRAWTGGSSGRELPEGRLERSMALSARKARTARAYERIVVPAL